MNRTSKKLAKILWRENRDLSAANLDCRFVRGLGDGTLACQAFRRYIAQDSYFLESFARAYAAGCLCAPDREGLRVFVELLNGVLIELKLHADYARTLKINLRRVRPHAATRAYTDFLLRAARAGKPGDLCAAMTPCMRLYAFLGQSLRAENQGRRHAYTKWIGTYSDPSFEVLATRLEDLLNRYGRDSRSVRWHYRRALELELAFFEAHA